MEYPVIDHRTEEDLMAEIEKKAKSYTPEWQPDRENPDAAAALALMFARIHYRTLAQFEKVLYKNQIDFYNRLQANMRPAAPAFGYVSFSLAGGVTEGVFLPKGTALLTDTEGIDGEKVQAETTEEVYVTSAAVEKIYESFSEPDYIGLLYDRGRENQEPFGLFGAGKENLARHVFCFGHPSLLNIGRTGRIAICWRGEKGLLEPLAKALAREDTAEFSYWTGERFEKFSRVYEEGGILYLEKRLSDPPAEPLELSGVVQFWVRLELRNYGAAGGLEFEDMRLLGACPVMIPDYVEAKGLDQGNGICMPFGERFGVYDEVLFASREVLGKRGAWITFSFREAFMKVPINEGSVRDDIQWKLIMPVSAVAVEREYDITIGEVTWEYFNGSGWVRLFPQKDYSDIFGVENGTAARRKTLVFRCPEDISPAFTGAGENYCIRARILRVNNGFKTEGNYVTPVISEINFQYEYGEPGVRPEYFLCENNMETRLIPAGKYLNGSQPFSPFWQNGDREPAVYVGFGERPSEGPLRMLWILKNSSSEPMPALVWEYFSGGRWRELNPADGTEHLRKTGLVTFYGNPDWTRADFFGESLYWLRLRDGTKGYGKGKKGLTPTAEAVIMNVSQASAVRSGYEEYVTLDEYRENFEHRLLYQNIHSLEVWIQETDSCTGKEEESLKKEGRLKLVLDREGLEKERWVLWKSVESFLGHGPGERIYLFDANNGRIQFGDNRKGKIPAVGVINGIYLRYCVGGGKETNLAPGKITGLEQSVGFISQAVNPLPFFGGCGRERVSEAISRCAGELKHQFRAVTLRDFERLAVSASGNIEKAKCFSDRGEKGEYQAGHVCLVILSKDYRTGEQGFPVLKEELKGFFQDKADPNLLREKRFHIAAPIFVEVGIQADIYVRDYGCSYEVKSGLLERLSRFLDPVFGGHGGHGWPIGQTPKREQILNLLREDGRVIYVGNLVLSYQVRRGEGNLEIGEEAVRKNPCILTVNGTHRLKMCQD